MSIPYNKSLFEAVQPENLRDFYSRVLYRRLPIIAERSVLYEKYKLGPAEEYIGTAEQNFRLLEAIASSP